MADTDEDPDFLQYAQTPKHVSTDEGSVTERSVDELISADRYKKLQTAVERPPWGMRVARVQPGGTLGRG